MTHNRGVSAGSSTLTGVPFTFSCKVIFADYPCRGPAISAQSFVTAFIVKRALHRQECLGVGCHDGIAVCDFLRPLVEESAKPHLSLIICGS
jgi:hypothetical protein